MAERKKPNFAQKPGFKVSEAAVKRRISEQNTNSLHGFGGDSDFLPDDVRYWLVMHAAKSDLDPAQQGKFVAAANQLAQMPDGYNDPIGPQRKAIKVIAQDAHRLLNSLNALSESAVATLSMHSREACIERPCPIPIEAAEKMLSVESTNLLDEAWDWVTALEAAAKYTAEQMKPSKQGKPTEALSRGMVANLAVCYMNLKGGDTPPKDNDAWFAHFSRILGGFMGLHFENTNAGKINGKPFIGPGIVESGIELAADPMEDPEKLID